jgi:hypothetical protein
MIILIKNCIQKEAKILIIVNKRDILVKLLAGNKILADVREMLFIFANTLSSAISLKTTNFGDKKYQIR